MIIDTRKDVIEEDGDLLTLENTSVANLVVGKPEYLDLPMVYPTPVYVKGDKGDAGDPGAITPEFVDRIADEVALDLSAELEPPVDLLLLFDNALA